MKTSLRQLLQSDTARRFSQFWLPSQRDSVTLRQSWKESAAPGDIWFYLIGRQSHRCYLSWPPSLSPDSLLRTKDVFCGQPMPSFENSQKTIPLWIRIRSKQSSTFMKHKRRRFCGCLANSLLRNYQIVSPHTLSFCTRN